MAAATAHPDPAQLQALTLGTLAETVRDEVETHVQGCPACQECAAHAADDGFVVLLRRAHAASAADTLTAVHTPQPAVWAGFSQTARFRTDVGGPATAAGGGESLPAELVGHERYRVVRLLGEGGMGSVYQAEHCAMQRMVALKVINPAYTHSPNAVERFRREVRAAARLSHPNIVTAFDAETAGRLNFLVMEYVEGVTLNRLVQEAGPLPVATACAYVRQAALGLQHAHERGMVHRDVKPANLIRGADGTVKVLDFGLAALASERTAGHTDSDVIMGTADYMAPEQAEDARAADIRADIYSLGCTLYFLLTGRAPYAGETAVQKLLAHREQPVPDIGALRPDVPRELGRVLARLLAKRPGDRHATPGEVAAALEPFTRPSAPGSERRGRGVAGLLLAAAAFCLTVAGVVVYHIQTDRGELVITTEGDDVEVVVKQGGKLVDIIDTKSRQKIRLSSGLYDLELKGASAGLKLDLTSATLLRGKTVIARIERHGTGAQPSLTPPQPVTAQIELLHRVPASWPEGFHYVTVARDGELFAADVGGNGLRTQVMVWDGKTGKERYRVDGWGAEFTPDGKWLVAHELPGDDSYYVREAATGKRLCSFSFDSPLDGWYLLPDSRHAVMWTRRGWSHLRHLESKEILHSWPTGSVHLVATRDGRILFFKPRGAAKYVAWDVGANRPSAEFGHLVKYPEFHLLPGDKQALVPAAEVGKHYFLDVTTGGVTPFPDRTWPPHVINGHARFDVRINLAGAANGQLYTFDYLTGKMTASLQLPGETLKNTRWVTIALSPEGRFGCVQTATAVYFLRLVERPAPGQVGSR